jgi:hypothetical protein
MNQKMSTHQKQSQDEATLFTRYGIIANPVTFMLVLFFSNFTLLGIQYLFSGK